MMQHNGLAKLCEELGELSQVVGKKLQYPEGEHPDGAGSLEQRMQEEIADVLAAITFVCFKMRLDGEAIIIRKADKFTKFLKWDKE